MAKINLKTRQRAFPMVYAYSTPQIKEHIGWTKIGYTEKQAVLTRISQQTHTSDVQFKIEWKGSAIFDDGSGKHFTDKDFHAYLRKDGVENKIGTEWFHIDGPSGKAMFDRFRSDGGIHIASDVQSYTLRTEQADAVTKAKEYATTNLEGEFLWNAKPRFGKTLATYDLCKQLDAKKVLIVTNRPAIANSWYTDYAKFLGEPSGYKFVSDSDTIKNLKYVLTREQFVGCGSSKLIEFVSLQDLKGSIYFGGKINKLQHLKDIYWDILVIDEAHEGVDTLKTDTAFDHLNRKFTLHLSGTPFKALANDKFRANEIYNWTYADEQKAKEEWTGDVDQNNPYENLPRLNLFTYQMSEIVQDTLSQGILINGETEEFAFDLNEFFETKNGKFVHDSSVTKFLDALTCQEKFPFSTDELRNELKHTFWILNRVDSAKALAKKLREHPVFCNYEIILAAGDGKVDDAEETQKSFDKVKAAIRQNDRTITLSVGQLTTGVTIPEWTAVLMLSNMKSPALYMQAAFRAQNPCMFSENGQFFRKENAYVFDFDPARTLIIFEEFANDLSTKTTGGKGTVEDREHNVRELLNFFPVIGEDAQGEMIPLDATQVLAIPRKIKSREVVRRGFMSNYLFQNISGIFSAPSEVLDIIQKFTPVTEPSAKEIKIPSGVSASVDPTTGEVKVPSERIIGTSNDIFGKKIYGKVQKEEVTNAINAVCDSGNHDTEDKQRKAFETFKTEFKQNTVETILNTAKETYQDDMKTRDVKALTENLNNKFEYTIEKVYKNYEINNRIADQARLNELRDRFKTGKTEEQIDAECKAKKTEFVEKLKEDLSSAVESFVETATVEVVEKVETNIVEHEKNTIEEKVRDHLRGFSRTIPSFLMAYGDKSNTAISLATFDQIVPDQVFQEVTSISIDEFRFLRDGGKYKDEATGEEKFFPGNLFDPVVFDDSVREFLQLKKKLSDYFNDSQSEDIFDYIPPQKTNQIFTPKSIVIDMVNLLEAENPGCFDNPSYTFVDLYMKSGLYITEIVKRLYKSQRMQTLFPDPKERLLHIFEHQVYGLAPTEIIYRIALSYILGFDETMSITNHKFRLADVTLAAKEGTVPELLNQLFDSRS